MIKKYLPILIITTLITLIPMLVGVIMWDKLPDEMPIHWNAQGEVDSYGSKAFTVFGLSALMVLFHIVCFLATLVDPKKKNVDGKPLVLVLWIIPVITLTCFFSVYSVALGSEISVEKLITFVVGVVFAVIGNYLPKCRQNYTIGIKIPWTLNDEDNWNKTHRFAGILWTVCGVLIAVTSYFTHFAVFIVLVGLMVAAPIIYSFCCYKMRSK